MAAKKKTLITKDDRPVERYAFVASYSDDADLFPSIDKLLEYVRKYFDGAGPNFNSPYFVYRLQPIGKLCIGGVVIEPYDEQEDDDL